MIKETLNGNSQKGEKEFSQECDLEKQRDVRIKRLLDMPEIQN